MMLRRKKMIEILMKLYSVMPLILFIVTVILIVNGVNKTKRYDECMGVIVAFRESTAYRVDSCGKKAISPIVEYQVNGQKYEFVGNFYSTNMTVGKKVNVMYDRNNIAKATIKTGIYVAPIITGGLTILFVLPIIIFVILKAKNIINF